jgi:hypothetical protein
MKDVIYKYIEIRYPRWLDHSEYWCSVKGIQAEAIDIMNEVIVDLLKKNDSKLEALYSKESKDGKYREIDFYVLRMIKLNIYSPTSPYQSRYKSIPTDDVDFARLRISDYSNEDEDKPGELLNKFHIVEEALGSLNLSIKAREVFKHRFLMGLPFSQWPGIEDKKELYDIYNKVVEMIKDKINGRILL